jgi:hypothetical protein
MVGSNEQQLTRQNIPYEYGVSRYCELAKVSFCLTVLLHRIANVNTTFPLLCFNLRR